MNKNILENIVLESNTLSEVLDKLNLSKGNNYKTLYKYLKRYDISTSHFNKVGSFNKKYDIEKDVLIENFLGHVNNKEIKKYLFDKNIKINKCELCGQDENWKGMKISLILDHINGINNDNRLENLRIVCPNCDAGLPTFKGRNRKKKEKKTENKNNNFINEKEHLIKQIKESGIDFTKKGWGSKLSKIINRSPAWTLKWVKNNIPDLYSICFKHIK